MPLELYKDVCPGGRSSGGESETQQNLSGKPFRLAFIAGFWYIFFFPCLEVYISEVFIPKVLARKFAARYSSALGL